jgi:hypothetical protein
MKGLFIPGITAEMFRNGCLESVEALMAEGEIYDIDYSPWIPVSERLPENLQTVNVTWQNHEPEPYYHDIKDRSFVATAVYYNEDWYWYSTTCADYLGEYGRNDVDKIDEAIEIIAWMPLPEPYKAESEDKGMNCGDCILDGTDACSRGAGRAIDDEPCGDFIGAESEDKE